MDTSMDAYLSFARMPDAEGLGALFAVSLRAPAAMLCLYYVDLRLPASVQAAHDAVLEWLRAHGYAVSVDAALVPYLS